ncbi:carboxypeptidase-like regulatory domain-containing protein [Chitinophaga pendula]|uniref:carboxypeptidase-like regulatory domain-containing protein n=1 Tax=Chitinophaga TaxID=79328 RepID=UPI000BAF78E3|nr:MULTISPECIES: carboxypeptidase-like regulatory domain-containing protein [Chitinophaga]ASZ10551.1 hypothetical protein CK934_05950 [Chitinophaga sp. MD30]UCJ06475.1 carboxypeptidase-like regulatory domain-containing protein [Chitinophaga pendula]
MSEKRSHIGNVVSEELIRQYLAGELDDKAMHQLEKQALDDPFLAEALEGYAAHVPDQRAALSELEGRLMQRVQQPVRQEKGKVRALYYRWAAAAAILVLMGISTLWLFRQPESRTPGIAMKTLPQVDTVVNSTALSDSAPLKEAAPSAALAAATPKKDLLAKDEVKRPATPKQRHPPVLAQRQQMAYAAPVPAEAATMDMSKVSTDHNDTVAAMAGMNAIKGVEVIGYKSMAESRSVSAAVTRVQPSDLTGDNVISNKLSGKVAGVPVIANERVLRGVVVDKDSREPLTGVTVATVKGRNGTVTDTEGRFSLPVDKQKSDVSLRFNYIGFNEEKRVIGADENDISIAMKPTNEALQEVVVTGMGRTKDKEDEDQTTYGSPRPEMGFKAFRQYLSEHTHFPPTETDRKQPVKVGVSFIVQPSGELSDFNIYRSAGKAFEDEAIRVIKEGPDWLPASDKKATRVKVMVRFKRH